MKTLFLILPLLFQGITCNAQEEFEEKIDAGIDGVKINAERSDISLKLNPVDSEELWEEIYSEYMITSTATVDVSKMDDFYGLKPSRAEIQFQSSYNNETGEEEGENIYQFTLFIEYPGDKDYQDFMRRVTLDLGPIRTYSIHEDNMKESPNWFTSVTLLTVSGDGVILEKDGKKYITVHYRQAYGG